MASDNHAHYSKIGFAVMIATVATVFTLIWLGGLGEGNNPVYAETYYDKSVSGLSVGSIVNFRGVPVGKVDIIDFVGNYYDVGGRENMRIYIRMALDRKKFQGVLDEKQTPEAVLEDLVKEGLRATVSASGITGISRIECDLHDEVQMPEVLSWRPNVPYIPAKLSLIEDFSSAATRVMNQINKMDFVGVWSNVNATTLHLSETVKSVCGIMQERRADLGKFVEDSAAAAASLKDFAAELKRNPSSLIREKRADRLDETR
jgi:paraquat-inducible protein B